MVRQPDPGEPRVVRAGAMPPGTPELPVAIVGAGACGLTAAIALQAERVEAVLLERDAASHGSTALSSGFVPAAGTPVQRAAGVADDSADRFADDIQRKAHGTASAGLVAAYTRAIVPALELLQRHGLRFELLDGFLYPGHAVRRMHALPQRTGAALIAALADAAARAGAARIDRALVRELWCDDGARVLGAGYARPDGRIEHVGCRQLVLACNGYGGNRAQVAELIPQMRDAIYAGHAGNDGSALAWGAALGARAADLGGYQGHGSWAVPHGVLITWALMTQGAIQVNSRGSRFHDESQGYSEAAVHVLSQPGGCAWVVFDEPLLALARTFPDFRDAQTAGAIRSFPDSRSLAGSIGCPVEPLQAALDAADPSFGRPPRRALVPPYHAVRVTGALFHTQGGLDVDPHCRVLRSDGTPFPNLLAAGGAARGVSGNAVWGYLSGNGLLSAIAGGFIAARTAAAALASPGGDG